MNDDERLSKTKVWCKAAIGLGSPSPEDKIQLRKSIPEEGDRYLSYSNQYEEFSLSWSKLDQSFSGQKAKRDPW